MTDACHFVAEVVQSMLCNCAVELLNSVIVLPIFQQSGIEVFRHADSGTWRTWKQGT